MGALDMRAWLQSVAAVDRLVQTLIDNLLSAHVAERRDIVADDFESGQAMVDDVSDWKGTCISPWLSRRLAATPGPVNLGEEVRLPRLQTPSRLDGRAERQAAPRRGRSRAGAPGGVAELRV